MGTEKKEKYLPDLAGRCYFFTCQARKCERTKNKDSQMKEGLRMSYQRKTKDRWDIMTNWGYGWECENSEYTREDARRSLREYRENYRGMAEVRLEKHREPITA